MKWNVAIKKIEQALAEGKKVEIVYHRKRYLYHESDIVWGIAEYEWEGEIAKDVQTYHDGVAEYSHIIDDVKIIPE